VHAPVTPPDSAARRGWRRFRAAAVALALLTGTLTFGAGPAAAFTTGDRVNTGVGAADQRGTAVGIAWVDRVTGEYRDSGAGAHTGVGSASIVKLFIADDLLARGALSPGDQGRFDVMLRSSDDDAANYFWNNDGGPDIVQRVAARYNLREVAPPVNPSFWGLTTITASSVASYYNGMLGGCCGLPDYARNTIVDRLRQSTTYGTDGYYQRFGIPTGLPDERTLAVKQGWMDVNGQRYNHTTGIVGDDNRFILVVLGYENRTNGDVNHTTETLNQVVGAMYPERIVPRVQGAIADDWYALGGATSPVGLPLGNENPIFDHSGVFTLFQRGSIYWSPASGAHEILGAIRDAWAAQGWEQGRLGYPVTDELGTPNQDGAYNHFQGGSLYWSPPTGAHLVAGAIQDAWAAQGWERSRLGYPVTDELGTPNQDGAYNHFQGGSLYWSPPTGAHLVAGAIQDAWAAQGWERSALGYPVTDELGTPNQDGAYNHFQGGSLYWSPPTGAHLVTGAIQDAWAAQGWERSALGYPTSDEAATASRTGAFNRFQHGAIYWSPGTGAHAMTAPILARWVSLGSETGALGYPTSDPYAVPGGTRVNFQGGSLTESTTTGAVSGGPTATPAATPAPTPAPTQAPATAAPAPGRPTPATSTTTTTPAPATTTPAPAMSTPAPAMSTPATSPAR